MWVARIIACLLPSFVVANMISPTEYSGLNFENKKVQHHLAVLVRAAQTCVVRVRAQPNDVRAYFTNYRPTTKSGECFAACMLESSRIVEYGKVNFDLLVHLASLVNGKNSRVVRKLSSVCRTCIHSTIGIKDRCGFAAAYNNCLNDNMKEFSFPSDLAEEIVRKMPFHIIKPKSEVKNFIDQVAKAINETNLTLELQLSEPSCDQRSQNEEGIDNREIKESDKTNEE